MQVKNITECWEHSAKLSTSIKLPFSIKTLVFLFLSGRLRHVLLYKQQGHFPFVCTGFYFPFAAGAFVLMLHLRVSIGGGGGGGGYMLVLLLAHLCRRLSVSFCALPLVVVGLYEVCDCGIS